MAEVWSMAKAIIRIMMDLFLRKGHMEMMKDI